MSEKMILETPCPGCIFDNPYDPEDPDASICIHYDCDAPDFKHFKPRPEVEKR